MERSGAPARVAGSLTTATTERPAVLGHSPQPQPVGIVHLVPTPPVRLDASGREMVGSRGHPANPEVDVVRQTELQRLSANQAQTGHRGVGHSHHVTYTSYPAGNRS